MVSILQEIDKHALMSWNRIINKGLYSVPKIKGTENKFFYECLVSLPTYNNQVQKINKLRKGSEVTSLEPHSMRPKIIFLAP